MTVSPLDSNIFGNLFGAPDLKRIFSDAERFQRMLDVEAALARVQGRLDIIPAAAAQSISANAKVSILDMAKMRHATERAGFPVIPLVAALSEACGKADGRYVHWGATTQDIVDTGLVLQMRDGLTIIERELGQAVERLTGHVRRHRQTVMAGRTHLQHAVPITFGHKAAVWLSSLLDARDHLAELKPRVLKVQYAGAAGTLSAIDGQGIAVLDGLAQELGLAKCDIAWHANRRSIAEVASFLALLCGSLAKIAKDITLMAQTEVAEIAETTAKGRGGSSTMPQKRNPIMSEYILASTRNVHALLPVLMGAMVHDHERASDSWQAEWAALPSMFVMTGGALAQALAILDGMHVDVARMRQNLDLTRGLIMAEAVQTALRPALGHDRAHSVVTAACNEAMASRQPLRDVLAATPDVSGAMSATQLDDAFDPAQYVGCSDAFIDRVLNRC